MGRTRGPYPPQFRAEAVRLVREGQVSPTQVGRDLGVSVDSIRDWVRAAEAEEGRGEQLSTTEREELLQLRRRVRILVYR